MLNTRGSWSQRSWKLLPGAGVTSAWDCTHRRGSIDLHVSMSESVSQAPVSQLISTCQLLDQHL